jgi:3'-phosphoadenosine 5'-phosphosulfate sulfotransferase (PAPS reductase)/FAD synthetase
MLTYWLSYGGGLNSTALAVLICERALPGFDPCRFLFADTGDEKDETYCYVDTYFKPYLKRHGRTLETVRDKETVLGRWERLSVTGSRILRVCTDHAKIKPIARLIKGSGETDNVQLIGIDAGEPGRASVARAGELPRRYPLIELGVDRKGCARIIKAAGLPLPVKSGCWHCPFMRRSEVIRLAIDRPDRFERIAELESAALDVHPVEPGKVRAQWGSRYAAEWRRIAREIESQGRLDFEDDDEPEDMPCGCYDGGTVRDKGD